MASTLIQTYNLQETPYSSAVKLGTAAASTELFVEVHDTTVRLFGNFKVSATVALPDNQIVVNLAEVVGSDVSLSPVNSAFAVSGMVPGAADNDPATSVNSGVAYMTGNTDVRISAATAFAVNVVVSLDITFNLQ